MDYFKNLYNQPPPAPRPNPKGFKMHNNFYKKGNLEERVMFARYNALNNKPRFLHETRHYPKSIIG